MAEEVGFEPTVPLRTTVFKTAAIGHSATPPRMTFLSAINYHDIKINSRVLNRGDIILLAITSCGQVTLLRLFQRF